MEQSPPKGDGMEKIVSLCKRRGFVFPGSEIYGGLANSWDYGPLGVALKNNIKQLWWKKFVEERDDMVGLDSAVIMSPKVWEASGHVKEFSDPLVECRKCHIRMRADELNKNACSNCGAGEFTEPRMFNILFKTFIGPVEDSKSTTYLRGETAQGIFVNFKNILDTTRKTLPFGVAQIGKAFRNEITPGNFIFRTREFEQMEIEYFIPEPDPENEESWMKYFEMWQLEMMNWIKEVGIRPENVVQVEIPDGERAFYSKRTIDFEYQYPFGQKELFGLAYRTDFDLKNHEKASGVNLKYKSADKEEAAYWPPVIEPSLGVDRMMLAVLLDAYDESDPERIVLKLKPKLAPYKAAVFPLLANKPELVAKAREVYDALRKEFAVAWDDRGNIGKRYYSQDEIGTPYCITVDFESLENPPAGGDVTIRDRDTAKQERVKISELANVIKERLK
ncbi:MAG: glycine--tRNA ligase [Candidatus Liptonbacteria bacterium GWB1_49_6]|uniref:Glycine--tRNA ligase n=1 Tax=Candidatus Liptonbacteria bacterium GWB1_49_6 TaxID=1798644 RepID=A0A1G2C729_9BACT|nr:MAG: glycine--tRNA ligase [Candidatus Liptonbacteria bacterium GWB1_49_6]